MKKNKKQQELKPVVPTRRTFTWWPWAAAVFGLFVVFEIYGPALNGEFVMDDRFLPFFSTRISDQFSGWVGRYRPLLMLTYWIDYRISHGVEPHAFHITGVFIHFLTSIVVALVSMKFLEWANVNRPMRATLAVFAGGLFLVHPLQTESVAYVAERAEALSVFLYYGAFAVFLYSPTETIGWLRSMAVIVLFGAAVATKEHTLTLPALLLLTDYFWSRGGVRKNRLLYGLFAVGALLGSTIVWRVIRESNTAGFHVPGMTPVTFFFTQCRVIWDYIGMFFFPFGQNIDPDVPLSHNPFEHGAILGFIALGALIAGAWIYRKRYPLAAFGIFTFLLLIAPTSSIVPIRDVMAERRVYLPFLGLALVCCEFLRRLKFSQAVSVGAATLAFCSVLTYKRSEVWASPLTLWQDSVSKSPDKYRPRFQLAYAQFEVQHCADSAKTYEAASRLGPVQQDLIVNWALALDCEGRWEEAVGKLHEAAQLHNTAHIRTQLGMVFAKHHHVAEALDELAEAEKLDSHYDVIYLYRGNILQMQGDRPAAAREYAHALRLNPQNQPARAALAQVGQ